MPKPLRHFVCSSCGAVQAKWAGKCSDCGEWNTLNERVIENAVEDLHRPPLAEAAIGGEGPPAVVPLDEIRPDAAVRWRTGLSELDRVLGGGLVAGSAVLLGGDPGVGKSTLALQAAAALSAAGKRTIYVTSEESPGQVRLRAERLRVAFAEGDGAEGEDPQPGDARRDGARAVAQRKSRSPQPSPFKGEGVVGSGVLVAAHSNLDVVLHQLRQHRPDVVIVDSIQMVYRPDLPSVPGSATQLRDCAARLTWLAKQMGFALILVGHVTKEGAIAGPKVLEHIVDCVIYFEGERFHSHRLIRAVKNRFGSTDELGIFEMTDGGLKPVEDPARLFLDRLDAARPGSVILTACEGSRVLTVEVQALCAQSVFGAAKRKVTGVDAGRVAMILAVLEKHAGCVLGDQDVFVNVVGGVKVLEPAADLAIALAVAGALTGRSIPAGAAAFGEVGLGGELRPVQHARRRIAEAGRIGLKSVLAPAGGRGAAARRTSAAATAQDESIAAAGAARAPEIVLCATLGEAIRQLA